MTDKADEISEDQFGQKHLYIKAWHRISIDTLVAAILYYVEKEHQDSIRRKRSFNFRWDLLNRGTLLVMAKEALVKHGQGIHSSEHYPTAKQMHYETAQRFVKELFPELVYDRQEYERRYEAFKRKLGLQ
jgi:hypothetical protein